VGAREVEEQSPQRQREKIEEREPEKVPAKT
jgi:hypothetical protein